MCCNFINRTFILLSALILLSVSASAFELDSLTMSRWKVGVSTGFHTNFLRFPGLAKSGYPSKDAGGSGLLLVSAEYKYDDNISIRPEIGFLSRGGSLYMSNVGKINNGLYTLNASYFDIRVPVLYKLNTYQSKYETYVYVAPVLGFARGGTLTMDEYLRNGTSNSYKLDLSNGNIASAYFALAAGAGVRTPIVISGVTCDVGLELGYEYGLTDTYSKKERRNETININNVSGPVASSRKNHGIELKVTLQAPLAIFKRKPKPVEEMSPAVKKVEKACYTLQEIKQLLEEGEAVDGKTICAIDDINFDTSKSTIKSSSRPYLDEVADILIMTGMCVEIKGHTDSTGSDEFNMQLSKQRALAVVKYLADRGVKWEKMSYSYYGESEPLVTNDTPEGRKVNRRVEFELYKMMLVQ